MSKKLKLEFPVLALTRSGNTDQKRYLKRHLPCLCKQVANFLTKMLVVTVSRIMVVTMNIKVPYCNFEVCICNDSLTKIFSVLWL